MLAAVLSAKGNDDVISPHRMGAWRLRTAKAGAVQILLAVFRPLQLSRLATVGPRVADNAGRSRKRSDDSHPNLELGMAEQLIRSTTLTAAKG